MSHLWPWVVLFGLGALHGINPGMGWLFALCLGLQEKRRQAVLAALPPIALGHAISVGLVVFLVAALRANLQPQLLRYASAAALIGYGSYRAIRSRHPRWVGMRVGFRDLTMWSFLMASAHGAGLMLVPVFLATRSGNDPSIAHHHETAGHHAGHLPLLAGPGVLTAAVLVHTLGHLIVAGLVALLFFEKLGLAVLKKAWFNIDFAWALALIATGVILLLM
ncbi:MAG TPA: hypothetical protein VH207_07745 [Chthoniobacterales bacterium]|jgi:hypothetical protein|nr:hypothetical protein [Chthoniobacterales bacterium]